MIEILPPRPPHTPTQEKETNNIVAIQLGVLQFSCALDPSPPRHHVRCQLLHANHRPARAPCLIRLYNGIWTDHLLVNGIWTDDDGIWIVCFTCLFIKFSLLTTKQIISPATSTFFLGVAVLGLGRFPFNGRMSWHVILIFLELY